MFIVSRKKDVFKISSIALFITGIVSRKKRSLEIVRRDE